MRQIKRLIAESESALSQGLKNGESEQLASLLDRVLANLGYAEGRFLLPVYPGDTLSSTSEVIGLRETSNGQSGVVWVRSTGRNQRGEPVLTYCRWVMVRKRDTSAPAPDVVVPDLAPGRTHTIRQR